MKSNCFLSVLLVLAHMWCIAQTPRINFKAPMQYPEGTAYDEVGKRFFVSSVKTGTIGTVDANGRYSVFYEDSTLKSSYGMKVDSKQNKLWVCTGDANYSKYTTPDTYRKLARLISLDLSSGKKVNDIDLSQLVAGEHFANDLTLDDGGNIYITDSYSPVIYKIDPQLKASILTQSEWFRSSDVGLNGIVWSPKGYLVVVHNSNGQLFKVDLKQPERITKIQSKMFFPGADGLLWDAAGNLMLIQNKGVNKIFQLSSTDNWQSAIVKAGTLVEHRFHHPTTGTIYASSMYVMNSKMNELSDPTAPPAKEFSLQQVKLVPMK